ncbi:MAG: hypothetical protein HOP12_12540 [Candidatus Eisenbacteria bacterium]|uniref:DUF5667 domain-containing protein n=1 Tax=Eiseniibacteriota bacterium TaxID=2212470 RepID=A0A849SMH3_UNCEI|nr:hypothetical protein [Candidatus Eisenbacteria bacterium]
MLPRSLKLALPLCLLAFAALLPAVAYAQLVTRERVEFAVARTDERIALADELVAAPDHVQAAAELSAARALQSSARAELARGDDRLRAALDLTLRARGRADRAIALVKGLPDPDRVLVQVERTREILDRASERMQDCRLDRALALMRVAGEMQTRAEAAVRESRYLAALQFTLSARERAFRALRLCNREDDLGESAGRAIERTAAVLERAREQVSESTESSVRVLFQRSETTQREAEQNLSVGRPDAALRLTLNARTLAHRVIRQLRDRR